MVQQAQTPPKKKRRKWPLIFLGIIILLIIIIVAASCGGSNTGTTTSTPGKATTTTGGSTTTTGDATTGSETTASTGGANTVKFGDKATVQGAEITVTAPVKSKDQFTADAGNILYMVLVTIDNKSSDVVRYDLSSLEAADTEGFTYGFWSFTGTQASAGDLQAGKSVKAYVDFEVPKANTITSITYTPFDSSVFATWEK